MTRWLRRSTRFLPTSGRGGRYGRYRNGAFGRRFRLGTSRGREAVRRGAAGSRHPMAGAHFRGHAVDPSVEARSRLSCLETVPGKCLQPPDAAADDARTRRVGSCPNGRLDALMFRDETQIAQGLRRYRDLLPWRRCAGVVGLFEDRPAVGPAGRAYRDVLVACPRRDATTAALRRPCFETKPRKINDIGGFRARND